MIWRVSVCCLLLVSGACALQQNMVLRRSALQMRRRLLQEGDGDGGSSESGIVELPPGSPDNECCDQLQAINFERTLPVVVVDTGGIEPTRDKRNASVCTCGSPENEDIIADITFGIRGGRNSQRRNNIKSFAIKLPESHKFLGMVSRKNWILYAQQLDPFGVKNWLGFNISRGTGEYASSTQFVELFIVNDDGPLAFAPHYRGIYLVEQKIGQGSNAVDIAETKTDLPPEQAGYILEFEHGQNYDNVPTVMGPVTYKPWNFKEPDEDVPPERVEYMQQALSNFENALFGPDFKDPAIGWRKWANETAFAHWFLSQELVKNVKHSYHGATFMYKDGSKPLAMGPNWAMTQGFGTCCGYPVEGYLQDGVSGPGLSGGSAISPNGWMFSICLEPQRCSVLEGYDAGNGISFWFTRLWQDEAWRQGLARRWQELRAGPWSDETLQATIAYKKKELSTAAMLRTLTRWEKELSQVPQWFATFEEQIDGIFGQLSDWVSKRLRWMDDAYEVAIAPGDAAFAPFPAAFPPEGGPTIRTGIDTAG